MSAERSSIETSDLVIVQADEPLLFFSSIRAAEEYLEPEDVMNGVYPGAWGGDGQTYLVEQRDGRVTLSPEALSPANPHMLRALLTRFLASQGVPVSPLETLRQLLSHCIPYVIR